MEKPNYANGNHGKAEKGNWRNLFTHIYENYLDDECLRKFSSDQVLFNEGERTDGIYCILSGKQKLVKRAEDGIQMIVDISSEGDMLGFTGLMSSDQLHTISAISIKQSEAYFIPEKVYFQIAEEYPSCSVRAMKILCQQLNTIEERVHIMSEKDIKKRFIDTLHFLKKRFGLDDKYNLKLNLKLQDLADLTGLPVDLVPAVLYDMEKAELLRFEQPRLQLLNPAI